MRVFRVKFTIALPTFKVFHYKLEDSSFERNIKAVKKVWEQNFKNCKKLRLLKMCVYLFLKTKFEARLHIGKSSALGSGGPWFQPHKD